MHVIAAAPAGFLNLNDIFIFHIYLTSCNLGFAIWTQQKRRDFDFKKIVDYNVVYCIVYTYYVLIFCRFFLWFST